MTLSAEAFRVKGRGPGIPCPVAAVLEQLPPKDRQVLEGALEDASVQHAAIERVLKEEGIRLPQLAVGRHRNKGCRCAT